MFRIFSKYLNLRLCFISGLFCLASCATQKNASSKSKIKRGPVQEPSLVDPKNPPQIRIEGLVPDTLFEDGSTIVISVSNFSIAKDWQGFELVLNDGEPERFYESKIEYKLSAKNLRKGANLLKAYLVRSWGESLKNVEAFAYVPFFFETKGLSWVAPGRPIVTLVSPRGNYQGEDAKKILFDFLIHTAAAGQKNWKVHYTLNGSKLELSSGKAYFFYDLVPGEYELKVEAVNSRGIPVGQEVSRSRSTFRVLPPDPSDP